MPRRTAAAGWWRAWPAPNSRCCSPRRRRSTRAASSPASWSRRSAGPFASGDHVITLGAKAGVAAAQAGDDAAALLRRASAALAEARDVDSAPVRVLEEGAESATARGDRLEVDLRRALDQDEIEIRFQPQVSVDHAARSSAPRRSPAGTIPNMASWAR